MINIFLNFICNEWDYLLFDMMSYWKPQLSLFASKIREKCIKLGYYFDTTFKIFGFIDNTMNAMCRPGGGPTRDGINAPRNDPIIQRSFYNGWKKCHGLKYQTVDIPNGMIFNAFGPVSCRHNDTFTLGESKIVEKLQNCLHLVNQIFIYMVTLHIHMIHTYAQDTLKKIRVEETAWKMEF